MWIQESTPPPGTGTRPTATHCGASWRPAATTAASIRHRVPRETIERLLEVFAVAPSVGLSQPWHVTVVEEPTLREGILQAPVGLVVSHVPPAGPTLGTTSVPAATEYSVVAAITLLWLAVTAEGLGMGWVNLVDSDHLSDTVPLPGGARPLAYLCLGHPARELDEPLLQTVGWGHRSPLSVDWV